VEQEVVDLWLGQARSRSDPPDVPVAAAVGPPAASPPLPSRQSFSGVVCHSARAGLDLFLTAMRGRRPTEDSGIAVGGPYVDRNEVLISAVSIPDIARILRYHGCVPVPIDLDVRTAQMTPQAVEAAISPRTWALFVTHIYGRFNPVDPFADIADKHRLCLIEDCAEAFAGTEYTGHPRSDVALFSFGTIKTQTALGGALVRFRDPDVAQGARQLRMEWPVQSTVRYRRKVLLVLVILVLQKPNGSRLLLSLVRALGLDHRPLFIDLLRNFKAGGEMDRLQQFRLRPCLGLLRALKYRLQYWDPTAFDNDMNKLRVFTRGLESHGIGVPGSAAHTVNFWLYPIICPPHVHPKRMERALEAYGVFASLGSTQLTLIHPPATGSYPRPTNADALMKQVLYLPVHRHVSEEQLRVMSRAVVHAFSALAQPQPRARL